MKTFVVSQVAIVFFVVGGIWNLYWSANLRPTLPPFNEYPRVVRPEFDYPFVVSDEQLQQILHKMRPRFADQPAKTNFIDHGLRMWGSNVRFDDDSLSGSQMLALLIDDEKFSQAWGDDVPALLSKNKDGIGVSVQEGRSTVSHVDHLLGTLAEIGLGLNHPIRTRDSEGCVGDLFCKAIADFQLNQKEYEWTALAVALYISRPAKWYSNEGQEISFDALVERIMRQEQPLGVCYGQHRLYTLAMILRIERQILDEGFGPLVCKSTRRRVQDYLLDMTRLLHQNQSVVGYWDGNWADSSKPVPDPETDKLSRRILATGHALEWWAMVPQSLHPPRETIVRAAQWLSRTIIEMDDRTVEKNYTFLTHAARALSLWRGKFPGEVYRSDAIARVKAQDIH